MSHARPLVPLLQQRATGMTRARLIAHTFRTGPVVAQGTFVVKHFLFVGGGAVASPPARGVPDYENVLRGTVVLLAEFGIGMVRRFVSRVGEDGRYVTLARFAIVEIVCPRESRVGEVRRHRRTVVVVLCLGGEPGEDRRRVTLPLVLCPREPRIGVDGRHRGAVVIVLCFGEARVG